MLKINEIFKSIQGESTHSGRVCTFIRLAGCNLRCDYCDTEYAFEAGENISIDEILKKVTDLGSKLVEITGGEPLLQPKVVKLVEVLAKNDFEVLIETNGSQNIADIIKKATKVMDVKCPDSGSGDSFLLSNLKYLDKKDECKFVISSEDDFNWAKNFVAEKSLTRICTVIFSPNTNSMPAEKLAELVSELNTSVRFGMQIHKVLWGDRKGV